MRHHYPQHDHRGRFQRSSAFQQMYYVRSISLSSGQVRRGRRHEPLISFRHSVLRGSDGRWGDKPAESHHLVKAGARHKVQLVLVALANLTL